MEKYFRAVLLFVWLNTKAPVDIFWIFIFWKWGDAETRERIPIQPVLFKNHSSLTGVQVSLRCNNLFVVTGAIM